MCRIRRSSTVFSEGRGCDGILSAGRGRERNGVSIPTSVSTRRGWKMDVHPPFGTGGSYNSTSRHRNGPLVEDVLLLSRKWFLFPSDASSSIPFVRSDPIEGTIVPGSSNHGDLSLVGPRTSPPPTKKKNKNTHPPRGTCLVIRGTHGKREGSIGFGGWSNTPFGWDLGIFSIRSFRNVPNHR